MTNITAKIIADSISTHGIRMTTMEIEYPRFILAELNTHRMLSKNSSSSRAIPLAAMHQQIQDNPAMPVYWGKNQPGMKAKEELVGSDRSQAEYLWRKFIQVSIEFAQQLGATGLHKQIANRPTETGMMMKTVISGTEWANLFWLRDHPDAQPEFRDLAHKMYHAMRYHEPTTLAPGEWHLPYVDVYRSPLDDRLSYLNPEGGEYSVEEARIVSASCCAQVSYRKNDDSLDKALKIYKQLIESTPAHASPVEHQATPMPDRLAVRDDTQANAWPPGVTHRSRDGSYWSGNLQGWIQHRKLIQHEAVWGQVLPADLSEEPDSI